MGFTIKGSGRVSDTECNPGSARGSLQQVQISVGKWHTFKRNNQETDEAMRPPRSDAPTSPPLGLPSPGPD